MCLLAPSACIVRRRRKPSVAARHNIENVEGLLSEVLVEGTLPAEAGSAEAKRALLFDRRGVVEPRVK